MRKFLHYFAVKVINVLIDLAPVELDINNRWYVGYDSWHVVEIKCGIYRWRGGYSPGVM
jgi:hypothetical protein